MQNLFQRSSLTLANAKTYIAEQGGKQQTTEMLNRAGRSLVSALQDWNKHNWSWLLKTTDIAIANGSANLPYDFKDMYSIRWTGETNTWIPARTRRHYNRIVYHHTTTALEPISYNLFSMGGYGRLDLQGSTASGTATVDYYRKLTLPCAITATGLSCASGSAHLWTSAASAFGDIYVGNPIALSAGWATGTSLTITAIKNEVNPTGGNVLGASIYLDASATASGTAISATAGGADYFVDMPQDFEWDILAQGVLHFLIGVGGPRDKVMEWKERAAMGLEKALMADKTEEDLDYGFQPDPDQPRKMWNPIMVYE